MTERKQLRPELFLLLKTFFIRKIYEQWVNKHLTLNKSINDEICSEELFIQEMAKPQMDPSKDKANTAKSKNDPLYITEHAVRRNTTNKINSSSSVSKYYQLNNTKKINPTELMFSEPRLKERNLHRMVYFFRQMKQFRNFISVNKIDDMSLYLICNSIKYLKIPKDKYVFKIKDQPDYFYGILSGRISIRQPVKVDEKEKDKDKDKGKDKNNHKNKEKDKKQEKCNEKDELDESDDDDHGKLIEPDDIHYKLLPRRKPIFAIENTFMDRLSASKKKDVSQQKASDEEVEIVCLQSGDYFGELGLIEDTGRSASAYTLVDTEMFLMEPKDFQYTIMKCMKKAEKARRNFFQKKMPQLNNSWIIDQLYRSTVRITPTKGHVLYTKGEPATYMYLIYEGSFHIKNYQNQLDPIIISSNGDFLGLETILNFKGFDNKAIYQETVIAQDEFNILFRFNTKTLRLYYIIELRDFFKKLLKEKNQIIADYMIKKKIIDKQTKVTFHVNAEEIKQKNNLRQVEKMILTRNFSGQVQTSHSHFKIRTPLLRSQVKKNISFIPQKLLNDASNSLNGLNTPNAVNPLNSLNTLKTPNALYSPNDPNTPSELIKSFKANENNIIKNKYLRHIQRSNNLKNQQSHQSITLKEDDHHKTTSLIIKTRPFSSKLTGRNENRYGNTNDSKEKDKKLFKTRIFKLKELKSLTKQGTIDKETSEINLTTKRTKLLDSSERIMQRSISYYSRHHPSSRQLFNSGRYALPMLSSEGYINVNM